MKVVIQRVSSAELFVLDSLHSKIDSRIDKGIVALVALVKGDTKEQVDKLIAKILRLRIFPDQQARMQLSLLDIEGDLLLVPQFTLAGATEKGLRPNFSAAMPPAEAEVLFDYMVAKTQQECAELGCSVRVKTGKFQATMRVALVNEGPVTLILTA